MTAKKMTAKRLRAVSINPPGPPRGADAVAQKLRAKMREEGAAIKLARTRAAEIEEMIRSVEKSGMDLGTVAVWFGVDRETGKLVLNLKIETPRTATAHARVATTRLDYDKLVNLKAFLDAHVAE